VHLGCLERDEKRKWVEWCNTPLRTELEKELETTFGLGPDLFSLPPDETTADSSAGLGTTPQNVRKSDGTQTFLQLCSEYDSERLGGSGRRRSIRVIRRPRSWVL
jgi:hypothetical protein